MPQGDLNLVLCLVVEETRGQVRTADTIAEQDKKGLGGGEGGTDTQSSAKTWS